MSGGVPVSDPKNRIVVDGVDLPRIFAFPKILTAAPTSLQPPRLIIALLIVTALITVGRLWDGVTKPAVHPNGLMAGNWSAEADGRRLQIVLHDAMNEFPPPAPSESSSTAGELDSRTVLKNITRTYRAERAGKETAEQQKLYDQRFAHMVALIENVRPRGVFEATIGHITDSFGQLIQSVLALSPAGVIQAADLLFIRTPQLLWLHQPWFVVVYGLIALAILSVGGGAISRMAACQIAGPQRLGLRESIDFALQHWVRLIAAQALPLVIAALVCGVVILLGISMAAPVLDVLGGVFYGIALLLGFLIAFLLVGYALGFPLLVPAVACENCDAADAMQRSYAYVVTRPLHLLAYWAIALIGLAVTFLLVSLLARLTLNVTAAAFGAISDNPAMTVAGGYVLGDPSQSTPPPVPGTWHNHWAAAAIMFWQMIVVCLVIAFVVSYHFSASTIVYLLMRKAADGQDIEDIWRPGFLPGTMTPVGAERKVPEEPARAAEVDVTAE
jgi:hypothetical protein